LDGVPWCGGRDDALCCRTALRGVLTLADADTQATTAMAPKKKTATGCSVGLVLEPHPMRLAVGPGPANSPNGGGPKAKESIAAWLDCDGPGRRSESNVQPGHEQPATLHRHAIV
jgi:hypothetical protein